jgi:hypothetical protein
MPSIADLLPPDIASQIHPDWRRNEAEYWASRDQILESYRDQWIGFADAQVIASGNSAVDVLHASQQSGRHPFVICVGRENEPCRIRRAVLAYDTQYAGEALPLVTVEFRTASGSPGAVLNEVIPDTGADASILPWTDCLHLQLSPAQGFPGLLSGVAGSASATIAFQIWAHLDGIDYRCRVQADFVGQERVLGRDVMNRLEILFRGPSGEVVINPYAQQAFKRRDALALVRVRPKMRSWPRTFLSERSMSPSRRGSDLKNICKAKANA